MKALVHRFPLVRCILICMAPSVAAMQLPSFELIAETEQIQRTSAQSVTEVIRTIQLSTGDRIQLIHILTPEGLLELDVSAQSTQALDAMERYCDAALAGATVRRSAKMVGTRAGIVLPPCGGEGRRPAPADRQEPQHMTPR